MTANNFIFWLKGFLVGVAGLDEEEIEIIKKEMDSVIIQETPALSPVIPQMPYTSGTGCQFPSDCGMPTVWHGVIPPVCSKCGYSAPSFDITCNDKT